MMSMQDVLALICGSGVGFSLALIGGGGSILAVPLLLYVVGVENAHMAIGTSALAVGVNAFANLIPHARAGHVRWKAAFIFAPFGMLGALAGSHVGKIVDGKHLLVLFAILMVVVAIMMLRSRRSAGDRYPLPHTNQRLAGVGFGAGTLSGFFGIGGGFLIVPGLMLASGMDILYAVGTSLFSVGSFGLTTAASYAYSHLIDWRIAAEFIGGGVVGGWLGVLGVKRLARTRGALNTVFAVVIILVAFYMLWRTLHH